jgi:hypothetical protein
LSVGGQRFGLVPGRFVRRCLQRPV